MKAENPIAVLWVGAGQDSTALLYKFCLEPAFKQKYIGNADLIAIMSDTGNEYPDTYVQVRYLQEFCKSHKVPFFFIKKEDGFHGKTWQSLTEQMKINQNIFSVGLPKTCTDNLKIRVCDNFLESFIKERYGYSGTKKKAFYHYEKAFGKLICMIGFAKGEESRRIVDNQLDLFPESKKDKRPVWKQKTIDTRYPLIDLKMDRQACQDYIKSIGLRLPMPSCCMFCPFQNEAEIVYLYRFHREKFNEWSLLEKAKLDKNAGIKRNLGVKGSLTLSEFLDKALLKYAYWDNQQLFEYKNSHGHCVKSKY